MVTSPIMESKDGSTALETSHAMEAEDVKIEVGDGMLAGDESYKIETSQIREARNESVGMKAEDGYVTMETKLFKLETDRERIMIHFKEEIEEEDRDEFIKFIDVCHQYIEQKSGLKRIEKNDVIVINLLGLGVILPSIDVWTDVYLAVKLHIAGHEGWAQAMLFPGYLNMGFSFYAWIKYENPMKTPIQALKTLPFVFIQFYPQVRALKVITNGCFYQKSDVPGFKWITDLEEYEATAAHLEGIVESTSTIFIQTAIVGSILAYQTEEILGLARSKCEDWCSSGSVLLDLASCNNMTRCISTCFAEFLSLDTEGNFTEEILNASKQNWLLTSNTTSHEVLNTQAYHYFVGEKTTFVFIFLISIVAASLSFANFLKSGFVRFTQSYLSKRFMLSLFTVLMTFILKIYSLMTFVTMDRTGLTNWIRKDERTDGRNVIVEGCYWLAIFVLPNALFGLVSLISFQTKYARKWEVIKLSIRTFANSPAVLIIPALGTITFRLKFVSVDALNKAELKLFASSVNQSQMVLVPRVSITLSVVNAGISVLITSITGVGRFELALFVGFLSVMGLWACCWLKARSPREKKILNQTKGKKGVNMG
eukprot:GFUD01037988.1.p1 GENE.GFUD01037988.1~~GFUD01037988.1.p1  ORF type:complete len:676 (+),score=130.63 GFUD01037988.1:242-2029(+)